MKATAKVKKRLWVYSLSALISAVVLLALARGVDGFAEWYARHIFPVFPYTLGRLCSPLFFSVFELFLLALAAGLLFALCYALLMLRSRATRARLACRAWRWAPRLFALLATLILLFTLTGGVNYSRASIAGAVGIEPRPASVEELRQLFNILAAQAGEQTAEILTDAEGYFCLPVVFWTAEMPGYLQRREYQPAGQARAALALLAEQYEVLNVYYPYPKAVFFSQGMSRFGIGGIFSPFTVEANYNRDMPDSNIPFSICHELAHLSGFMREDEANFIAYLACQNSGNPYFCYSGTFYALIYVLNALYDVTPAEEYGELYGALPAQLRRDMRRNSDYWQRFAGKAAELSENINDAYLKANSQPEGVQSYGRMVDLLLAYYIRE